MHPVGFTDGFFRQLLIAYGAGLGTVLTPCIYPLIPVTLSLFGVASHLSRWKAFFLSACYVAGICVTYTVLGLISVKTKILFGSALGNVWVIGTLAFFFVLLALSSLELIQLPVLSRLQHMCCKVGGKGFSGSFLMGSMSGFVAAPCAGPILAGILTVAAATGDTLKAGLLLFIYALGFGTVFLLLGTFSNLTQSLPRPGEWLNGIKFITAAALLAVVVYLLQPFLPDGALNVSSRLVALGVAVAMLLIVHHGYRHDSKFIKTVCAFVLALAIARIAFGGVTVQAATTPMAEGGPQKWSPSIEAALDEARAKHTIVMVDFFADWCGACKELDAATFSDPAVQTQLHTLALGKLDFTDIDDTKQTLLNRYNIPGLPAVLFIGADGNEIPGTRVTGFVPPDEFLKHVAAAESDKPA